MAQKKSRISSFIQLLFLFLLAYSILRSPAGACAYASLALRLWFEKMIPSLFPFMVLSGLVVRLHYGRIISAPIYPVMGRLYRISRSMCAALLSGFLFGFPLGAKTVAEQYELRQLSKPQAQYLLSFCNNIGPIYLLGFALPLLGLSDAFGHFPGSAAIISVFFGIPLIYGLILRYTVYRSVDLTWEPPEHFVPSASALPHSRSNGRKQKPETSARLSAASADQPTDSSSADSSFLSALDRSVTSACAAITRLGGYMVFFMVCNLLFEKTPFAAFLSAVLEITSGLTVAKDVLPPALSMTMLTFGGLSCFAQAYTCIRDTDLSFGNYCFHKLLQSAIAFFLYTLLFSVSF